MKKLNLKFNGDGMNTIITKIIAYAICLQLTVGTYPILNHNLAHAQDDRSITTETDGPSRGPASENIHMDATEASDNSMNYINNFQEQCVGANQEIKANVAFMHDKEIGGEEPRIYNCGAAAEVIQKIIIPGMNDVVNEAQHAKVDPNCPSCGLQAVGTGATTAVPAAEQAANNGELCSAAEQAKFAKDAEKCDTGCAVTSVISFGMAAKDSCDSSYKNPAVGGKCLAELAKGVIHGITEVLLFIPKLIWDGAKLGWNKLFGDSESKTSEKMHALSGLSNEEIKQGKTNPEALKQTFLQKAANFFKQLGKAMIGYPEYEEQAKCTDCGGKAALMCGMVGNTGGFLLTIFGNGLIFGATSGGISNIAGKIVELSKGTGRIAKFATSTIKVAQKTKAVASTVGKYVAKPFIGMGNIIVKGASKVSQATIKGWTKFQGSKLYANLGKFKNTQVYKKVLSAESIPGKITLKIGRGVGSTVGYVGGGIGKGFKKMGEFEDRMFVKGVGITNKGLQKTMLRAQKINQLRAARLAEGVNGPLPEKELIAAKNELSTEVKGVKHNDLNDIENAIESDFRINPKSKNSVLVQIEKGEQEIKGVNTAEVSSIHTYQDGKFAIVVNKDGSMILHDLGKNSTVAVVKDKQKSELINKIMVRETVNDVEKSSAATNEALRGVDELKVVRDPADARTLEQWTDLKKKASNELNGLKVKNLDDIENATKTEFSIASGKEKALIVETPKGPKELKIANPSEVESVHIYQDGKYAIAQNKNGSYVIHDLNEGRHVTQVSEGKSEYVDALLGKKTKNFDALESMSYDQVKTNLKINGTKYTEEVDAAGAKTLKIETPNGCSPKTLTFGVDKAL